MLDIGVDIELPVPTEVVFQSVGDTACIELTLIDDEDYEGEQTFTMVFGHLSVSPSLAITSGSYAIFVHDNTGKCITGQACVWNY